MIQIYADGVPVYDSRLREPGKDYSLLGLSVTTAENKGGAARIVMPPYHPAYSALVSHRTIVEFYRDRKLGFRGRVLYPEDDNFNRRIWTCEGELCLFKDGLSRPYLYQDTPAAVFTAVVEAYNAQVETYKQFRVGEITVTDPNDYIRLESASAEQSLDTLNKLLQRCGGYFVFSTADDGVRVINWYAEPGFRSNQSIEFGENLLDFASDGISTDLATVLIPYGAQDPETGERVNISSVNDGLDYVADEEARALRGTIVRPVYFDDVTEPANLLRKAQQLLAERRNVITTLTLTAADLACLDKSLDSFRAGDVIRVRSKPHGVDEDFKLTEYTEDWLNPGKGSITLGKSKSTLTDAAVSGDNKTLSEVQKTAREIKADYTLNLAKAIEETERLFRSLIEQTSESIRLEVAATYTTSDQLNSAISTSMTQLADSFTFAFNELQAVVDENGEIVEGRFTELYSYIKMAGGSITFGSSENGITLTLENDLIVFKKNGVQFGWWDGVDFHTGNIIVEVNERAQFGNFAFIPRSGGNLSLLKVGG